VADKRKSFRDNLTKNLAGSEPFLVPVSQASAMIGRCPRAIYDLMAVGELKAVKSGRSTLIIYDSIKNYVTNLPAAKIKQYIRRGEAV
jgi:hypothetical protein